MGSNPTRTPRRIDVDSTWILRGHVEDQISTNLHIVSTYFFDVISLIEISTQFPRTFFDVISMVEESTQFSRTFFNVISMVEKSLLFPRTFSDVILMVEKSTLFPPTFVDVILVKKDGQKIYLSPTCIFRCNFFYRNIQSFYLLLSM